MNKSEKKEYNGKYHSQEFYDYLKERGLIIFETIIGSQAYGTATENSDIDKKFIYVLPEEVILGLDYIPQININADYVGYEIKRFLELLETNNPNILELLNSPEDMILHKDPIFDLVLEKRNEFITKQCKNSFGGYARQQIHKAKGQDKMMNWERDKVTRKTPLDFCYIIEANQTRKLTTFLNDNEYNQLFCGVVNIPNAKDMYALYYDGDAELCFDERYTEKERTENKLIINNNNQSFGKGYKGIVKFDKNSEVVSNELRLSSVSKVDALDPVVIFSYNKDGYIKHCKDYKQYQDWLKNRNTQRWVDVDGHGQKIDGKTENSKIDGKNMLHCIRLIDMAKEIGEGKGIIVKRPNAEFLLDIRHGKVDLNSILKLADDGIKNIDEIFDNSTLPDKVDHEMVNELLILIRKRIYNKHD